MWRVSSKDPHRWVQYDTGTVTGDPESTSDMTALAGRPVAYAPLAATYTPTSRTDEVGLYLLALTVVPDPHTVTGVPPRLRAPADGLYPPDAVH